MKLLSDQNLSHRLSQLLAVEYPGSEHVRNVGPGSADDQDVWDYARQNGFAIVSKDSDFQHRALVYGHPPKVIWLRIGTGPTAVIVATLRDRAADVEAFDGDSTASVLLLT